jgi:hypothetical protein
MRWRPLIDGAITAYRAAQADATLEASDQGGNPLRRADARYLRGRQARSGLLQATRPGAAERRRQTTTIEIEVVGRWDALALSELLIPFHSFLVQHDHDRWVVHARAPGFRGESLSDALAAINGWRFERHLEAASCRVGGRPYDLSEARVA